MNKVRTWTLMGWLLAGVGAAHAQGLLSIGNTSDDFDTDIPLTWTVSASVGWDDNVNSAPRDEEDSMYVQAGVGARYAGGSRVTRYSVGASFSLIWYDEEVALDPFRSNDTEDLFWNARLSFGFNHRFSRRLNISNNAYISYEIEPDQDIGASQNRRTDQYVYGYNRFSVQYAWTRRFSTITSYTLAWIGYEDSSRDDRLRHQLGIQGRYVYNRTTTLTGTYRFGYTDYDDRDESYTHYLLAGVEHNFSRVTRGSFNVGVNIRDNDSDTKTKPYFEGSIAHRPTEDLTVRGVVRYGFEDGELGGYNYRETLRIGANVAYRFTPRLTGTAGVTYNHSEYEDSDFAFVSDGDEDYFAFNVGLSYLVYNNIRLNAGYSYMTLDSGRDDVNFDPDYDRNRFNLGVSATF